VNRYLTPSKTRISEDCRPTPDNVPVSYGINRQAGRPSAAKQINTSILLDFSGEFIVGWQQRWTFHRYRT